MDPKGWWEWEHLRPNEPRILKASTYCSKRGARINLLPSPLTQETARRILLLGPCTPFAFEAPCRVLGPSPNPVHSLLGWWLSSFPLPCRPMPAYSCPSREHLTLGHPKPQFVIKSE